MPLKNVLHSRSHKERSQLSHRAKFGILEKHKDYVLRARDYHSKQDRIQRLRQKAADRNKDEFYFGMNKQRTREGVHIQDRGNTSLPLDMVKVLKSQDENYIRTMRAAGQKKIEKLKVQITMLADLIAPHLSNGKEDNDDDEDLEGGLEDEELETLRQAGIISGKSSKRRSKKPTNHLVFVDNESEARSYMNASKKQKDPNSSDDGKEHEVLDLGWKKVSTPTKKRKLRVEDEDDVEDERQESAKKHRTRLLKELSARLHRDKLLRYTEQELTMQRTLMGKGQSKKLSGIEKVEGEDSEDELNEDELDSMRIKKSALIATKKEKIYKPRVYKWKSERKK